jgi:hypothetical protein
VYLVKAIALFIHVPHGLVMKAMCPHKEMWSNGSTGFIGSVKAKANEKG